MSALTETPTHSLLPPCISWASTHLPIGAMVTWRRQPSTHKPNGFEPASTP
jgi:hypothetical protein